MWQTIKQSLKKIFVSTIILTLFLSGFPSKEFFTFANKVLHNGNIIENLYLALQDTNILDRNARLLLNSPVPKASAATFQMNTGYYIGNGGVKTITGLGFRPELIVLKSDSNTLQTVFHTNIMPEDTTAYMGTATADSTAGFVRIEADGFKVYTTATNTLNVRYTWVAFAGSDCSASGTMCIGSYVGNGAANQAITSVGFQPDLVWTKRTTAERDATWRSSSMPANHGQFFSATGANTTGTLFQTLDATGFTVGLSNNTSTGIYYYVAFKEVSGFMDVGTYTGNSVDNRSITGVGFKPDWVFLKSTVSAFAQAGVHSQRESYGDSTSYMTNTANLVDSIQALENDGFQVGTHPTSNGNANTYYYAAFKGVPAVSSSGTFKMASGSYTANNTIKIIEGLDFKPDLVIIKGETTQAGVFRTSLMGGDSTAYLDSATNNFAGGITAMNHDGFTIGSNATVNTNGVVYHWQAFGNAWNPETKSGSSDFYIGAYYGNTIDNRNITDLPFQANLVVIKRFGASAGAFRTSAHTGDTTSFFAATADAANHIQAINSDGFQLGNPTNTVNTDAVTYFYFGFKEGVDFDVGTYTGNAVDNRDITNPGFDPNLAWIKGSTAVAGVTRPSTLAGDLTQYFITTAQAAGRIKSFVTGGFRLGTQTEVNANGGTYYYATWDNNSTQNYTPASYAMRTGYYMGNGLYQDITGLGFRPELVILKPDTVAGHGSLYKTKYMPENGVNGLSTNSTPANLTETSSYDITLLEDGFRAVGANSNTVNVGHQWMAFAGSDCSSTGTMCIGSYIGNATNPRNISTGFDPTYVSVGPKSGIHSFITDRALATEGAGAFAYSNAIYTASANFFSSLINNFSFTINSSLNAAATTHYFFSFRDSKDLSYSWTRTFGANSERGYGIATDSNNNVFATGYFSGTIDFDATAGTDNKTAVGSVDIYITKYNSDGTYGWTRTFGSNSTDQGLSVAVDSNDNVIVTGSFQATADFDGTAGTDSKTNVGDFDIFITKYNSDGSYGWTRTFGSNLVDEGFGVAVDNNDNILATGYFRGTVDFNDAGGTDNKTSVGDTDIFITKYNSDGSYGWTRTFGSNSTGGSINETGQDIAVDSNNNVFATGYFRGTADFNDAGGTDNKTAVGSQDIFITKYNSDGSYGWTKNFGSVTSSSQGNGIAVDNNDNVITTGSFQGTIDFDSTGGTDNKTPVGSQDLFITKYNSDESYGWTRTFGGTTGEFSRGIATDNNNSIVTVGYFSGTADFDGTGGIDSKTSAGIDDIFITKYNSDGSYAQTRIVGGTSDDEGNGIAVDNNNNVLATGHFNGTVDFDGTGGTDNKTATSDDSFITKYNYHLQEDYFDTNQYTGNATDNTNITGVGFDPDAVIVKGDVAGYGVFNTKYSDGDNTSYFYDAANLISAVKLLITDGFKIGTNAAVNTNAIAYYYNAFKETELPVTPSGSFTMETGSYVGNGAYKRISGLSGKPDMVMIKGDTAQQSVFRTKTMPVNSTAYLGSATANLALAISSLNHDGFNVGNNASVNSAGVTYHWQAFYGAYDEKNGGSTNFALGAYLGNGVDNRNIETVSFQPDTVKVKRSGASAGVFRTSAHSGDTASLLSTTVDTSNTIQSFNSLGYQIGTDATVNTAANNYWWFAFKEGSRFKVGTYSGNSTDNRDITAPGFDPSLVWIKRSNATAAAGVLRPSTLAGDSTQYFINTANAVGRIKAFITGGFRLGTDAQVNATGGTYFWSAWSTAGIPDPTFTQAAYRFFENNNSADVGSALEIQDTPAVLNNTGDAFRLRLLLAVDTANLSINGQDFKLQYADKGAGSCASPSGGTPASYTDVTAGTLIAFNDNAARSDENNFSANANDPINGGRTIVNQSYQELNNFTNNQADINNGQDGKWDFALVDNGADADTTFCFRVVKSDGNVINTYTQYPEITTAPISQSLAFSISDNSVGFGNLSASEARYATGDTVGSTTDSADSHTISASASATGGYVLTINGQTLTCAGCGGATIDAIGGTALASSIGTNQFGLRLIVNSGTGLSTPPYASSNWAFDDTSLPDEVASGNGDGSTTVFGVRYIANRESIADAGNYSATLTYTVTATY